MQGLLGLFTLLLLLIIALGYPLIIIKTLDKFYMDYPLQKSLRVQSEKITDKTDTILGIIYFGNASLSAIVLLITTNVFGSSNSVPLLIFDIWHIVFMIGFYPFVVIYAKQAICNAFNGYQSIKF